MRLREAFRTAFRACSAENAVFVFLLFSLLWSGGSQPMIALLSVAVAAWCAWSRLRERHRTASPIGWAAVAFALWTLCAFAFSRTRTVGAEDVLLAAAYAVLFLWSAHRTRVSPAYVPRLLLTLSVVAACAAALGAAVYVLQPVSRFVGSFVDPAVRSSYWPNAWAAYVLLAWPAVLAAPSSRGRAWIPAASAGALLGTLALSHSRAGWIAFAAQCVWLAASGGARSRRSLRMAAVSACAALCVFCSLNLLRGIRFPVQSFTQRIAFAVPDEGVVSATERWEFWGQAWTAAAARPVLGWGPGSFRYVQRLLPGGTYATAASPHSVVLQLAAERGWPAAFLFLFTGGAVAYAVFRPGKEGKDARMRRRFLVAAVVGVAVHLCFDDDLRLVAVGLPFCLLAGACAAPLSRSGTRRADAPAACLLASIALLGAGWQAYGETAAALAVRARAEGRMADALSWYAFASRRPASRDALLREGLLLDEVGRPAEARAAFLEHARRNPLDVRAWAYAADGAETEDDVASLRVLRERAFQLGHRSHPSTLTALLRVLLADPDTSALSGAKPRLDASFDGFVAALERNTRYSALTPDAEEILYASRLLSSAFPADAPRYAAAAQRVQSAIVRHRAEQEAQPRGLLWN